MTHSVGALAPALAIGEIIIRQHDGLFSLNDLHIAAGKLETHKPKFWLANKQTQDLAAEIQKGGILPFKVWRGVYGGTYACRELVIAYAAWISPAFHLKVIRVFLGFDKRENRAMILLSPQTTGVGFASPVWRRTHRHPRNRRFFCVRSMASPMGGPCGRAKALPGTPTGLATRTVSPTRLQAGGRGSEPHIGVLP